MISEKVFIYSEPSITLSINWTKELKDFILKNFVSYYINPTCLTSGYPLVYFVRRKLINQGLLLHEPFYLEDANNKYNYEKRDKLYTEFLKLYNWIDHKFNDLELTLWLADYAI
jgi:hypothetical protein